ncbi:uncharacterized protein LOC144631365 isoform X2 [Oculina patagonica]
MTGGNLLNRPKTALQKNLNKLTRVKKAQKKKQQQKSKGPQQRAGASVSAKKKRLIMKQIKRQQKEENAMEVIPQPQSSKKSEGKAKKESKTEKMDIS